MQRARVVGRATATVKHPSLNRQKLLIVQPLLSDGISPDGDPVLSLDHLGAGLGDEILITSDGRALREILQDKSTPARWSVMGILDS